MKIVVFGPDRRTGVLRGEDVVDISRAYDKLIRERDGERHPLELASALVPADLERFIEGGDRSLDHAQVALDYLFGDAQDQTGAIGEQLHFQVSCRHGGRTSLRWAP